MVDLMHCGVSMSETRSLLGSVYLIGDYYANTVCEFLVVIERNGQLPVCDVNVVLHLVAAGSLDVMKPRAYRRDP